MVEAKEPNYASVSLSAVVKPQEERGLLDFAWQEREYKIKQPEAWYKISFISLIE